jgi:hypothetical protein
MRESVKEGVTRPEEGEGETDQKPTGDCHNETKDRAVHSEMLADDEQPDSGIGKSGLG